MTEKVLPFPHMSVTRAREIVSYPDAHGGAEILAACQALLKDGSVADMQAVLDLQRAGIVAGFESTTIRGAKSRARRARWEMIGGLYVLFAAAMGTVVLAAWLFNSIRAVVS